LRTDASASASPKLDTTNGLLINLKAKQVPPAAEQSD